MKCPCCGGEMAGPALDLLWLFQRAPVEMTIAKMLLRKFPETVTRDFLLSEIYGSRDRQPDDAAMCLMSHVHRMRRKLKPHGWTIPHSIKHASAYRLVKLED